MGTEVQPVNSNIPKGKANLTNPFNISNLSRDNKVQLHKIHLQNVIPACFGSGIN